MHNLMFNHYDFYVGMVVGICMVTAVALYLSGKSVAGLSYKTVKNITMPQRTRCPFCGDGGYSIIARKKPDDFMSCANEDCAIYGITMTVEQWETRDHISL